MGLKRDILQQTWQSYRFHRKLQRSRPNLSLIAPLTHRIILGFIVYNLLIGYAILEQQVSRLIIIGGIFNQTFWACIFFALSIWLTIGLFLNDWGVIRAAMSMGVLIKVLWTYALIALGVQTGFRPIIGVLTLWGFAAWVQIVTVIYFTPNGKPNASRSSFDQ